MSEDRFAFVVDHVLSEGEGNALRGGVDGVMVERERARTMLVFDREAASLAEALVCALRDVERAGLVVGSVRSHDLVTLREIAARTGRTYEGARLPACGARGRGGFPGPMSSNGWALYSWAQVRSWFASPVRDRTLDREPQAVERDRLIAAADHLVRARGLMRGHDWADRLACLIRA
jgi:hypothetical protein